MRAPICIRLPREPQDGIFLGFGILGGVRIPETGHRVREGKGDTSRIKACTSQSDHTGGICRGRCGREASLSPIGSRIGLPNERRSTSNGPVGSCSVAQPLASVVSFGAARGQGRTLNLVPLDFALAEW
jgi:hypothetical protein